MRKYYIILFLAISAHSFGQIPDGYYVGLERMCWTNNKGKKECFDPPRKWYHINHLLVENDSLFLYKEPVIIKHKDTLYSASDGAFFYYAGKFLNNNKASVSFTFTNCDYCGRTIKIDTLTNTYVEVSVTERYPVILNKDELIINDIKYRFSKTEEFPFNKDVFDKFFKVQDYKPQKFK